MLKLHAAQILAEQLEVDKYKSRDLVLSWPCKSLSAVGTRKSTHFQTLVEGLDPVLLGGEIGACVSVLRGQEEHLGVALLPHLRVRLRAQVPMVHLLLHVLHLRLQKHFGLNNKKAFVGKTQEKNRVFDNSTATICCYFIQSTWCPEMFCLNSCVGPVPLQSRSGRTFRACGSRGRQGAAPGWQSTSDSAFSCRGWCPAGSRSGCTRRRGESLSPSLAWWALQPAINYHRPCRHSWQRHIFQEKESSSMIPFAYPLQFVQLRIIRSHRSQHGHVDIIRTRQVALHGLRALLHLPLPCDTTNAQLVQLGRKMAHQKTSAWLSAGV